MLNGVLPIDKPAGISSAKAVARVKKALSVRKIGHAGTLDPFATGLLLCCLNQATRLSRFLLESRKTYEATLFLGIETDTQDLTGETVSRREDVSAGDEEIRAVFQRFTGKLLQTPPVYSALKHKGVPLYRLARAGKPVEKPPREISIYHLAVTGIRLPEIDFRVTCSSGTYVRTLAADIGKALGCGGHLISLRRTEAGPFHVGKALPLSALENPGLAGAENRVISPADALSRLPVYVSDNRLTRRLMCGNKMTPDDIPPDRIAGAGGFLRVITPEGDLLAVLERPEGQNNYNYCCVFPPNGG